MTTTGSSSGPVDPQSAFSPHDILCMRRALRLATISLGRTWPNPGVGCVIARDGQILSQGRHAVYGQAHAEINALMQCLGQGIDPAGATLYTTLAPCTRQGKQPPCSDTLVAARFARVVAGINDPSQLDPREQFSASGIIYQVGCCQLQAQLLHGGFLQRVTSGRPRLTGKWAMTLDGSLATANGDSAWISGKTALGASRRRRRVFDAILIGAGTAARDDPLLLSSHPIQRTPLRLVVSAGAELAIDSRVVASLSQGTVVVIHGPGASAANRERLEFAGIELLQVDHPHDPVAVAQALGAYGLNEVVIEGGAQVHGSFLRAGLYDRLELAIGCMTIGGGTGVCAGIGDDMLAHGQRWALEQPPLQLGDTTCLRLRRDDGPEEDRAPVVLVE